MLERLRSKYHKKGAEISDSEVKYIPLPQNAKFPHTPEPLQPEILPRFGNIYSHKLPWLRIINYKKSPKPFMHANPLVDLPETNEFYSISSEPVIDFSSLK